MRRILMDLLKPITMSHVTILFWGILIGLFIGLAIPNMVLAQEQKPLTPEQRVEALTGAILNLKMNLAAEKSGWAEEMKIATRLKAQNIVLRKQLAEAIAKVAQLETKPEIHPYDVAPGEVIDVPKE
ncbi:hypothetical protein LCGC14_2624330 [marine sediment metagenome]|uniref:Uncharacterized protein n=1 Tax=marine sediment metagenome TaxID=412755 RepID=A0A0F9APR5_9ZZZZ